MTICAPCRISLQNCRRPSPSLTRQTPPAWIKGARLRNKTVATSVINRISRVWIMCLGSPANARITCFAGQREDYLLKSLRAYKDNSRRGYDAQMSEVVYAMKDEDFVDLAYFLARVK